MGELTALLKKVIPITTYRNCIVTKTKSGYKVLGVHCKTVLEVDAAIEKSLENLSKSIKK